MLKSALFVGAPFDISLLHLLEMLGMLREEGNLVLPCLARHLQLHRCEQGWLSAGLMKTGLMTFVGVLTSRLQLRHLSP